MILRLFVLLCICIAPTRSAFSSTYSATAFSKNVTQLLNSLLSNYDRRIRPGHGGVPTTIMLNMNVRSMGPFSEKQESYSMQLYLRQNWYDSRLKFNYTDWGRFQFSMNWAFAAKLWKPDTFFINGKNSYAHAITAPNMFIRLAHDGHITWSMRLTVRAACKMHLRKFPLDTQQCPLRLASYGYTSKDIVYKWDPQKLVTVDSDVSIAQYELVNITTSQASVTVRRRENRQEEIISTLMVKFQLQRLTGFFMLQVYIPCILIVCCSWVAFWITKKDAAGRVALGVTTVLSMTTLGFAGRSAWPAVSYATALDYFVILCFAFVFAAVLEFAAINFFERAVTKRRKKLEDFRQKVIEKKKTNAENDATMIVTTEVKEAEIIVPDIKDSLMEVLKVPLTVVPRSLLDDDEIEDIENDTEVLIGQTEGTPTITVLEEKKESLIIQSTGCSPVSEDASPPPLPDSPPPPLESPLFVIPVPPPSPDSTPPNNASQETHTHSPTDQLTPDSPIPSSETTVIKVEGGEPPQSPLVPNFTVWEILTKRKKIIAQMNTAFTMPTEEDVLDRFSIIDIYSRRIFPSLFFILFSTYWILFNYYITDEFPHEHKVPSDGLIN